MQKKLTPDILEAIRRDREAGASLPVLCSTFGLSKGTIQNALKTLGCCKLQSSQSSPRRKRSIELEHLRGGCELREGGRPAQTKLLGDATEAVVLAALVRKGITVLLPFGDKERYDMVIHSNSGRFLRVQCKTAWVDRKRKHVIQFKTCFRVGRTSKVSETYTATMVDGFAVWSPEYDLLMWVPVECVTAKETMSINLDTTAQGLWNTNTPQAFPFEALLSL